MAKTLALTRIMVCVSLILVSLSQNASALAYVDNAYNPIGWMRILPRDFSRSALLWNAADILIPLALGIALIGYRTRISLFIGALAVLVEGGLLRGHTFNFHPGVVAAQMAFVMTFTPCGDTWSLDARWGRTKTHSEDVYRWSVVLAWMPFASAYLMAGLNKLRYGGLDWFAPSTMKSFVAMGHLRMGVAPNDTYGLISAVPNPLWSLVALGSVALEVLYITVLGSRWARLILPPALFVMHVIMGFWGVGAWFFDFIVLQFAVFDWRLAWHFVLKLRLRYSRLRLQQSG
jgi:hypothetical protein